MDIEKKEMGIVVDDGSITVPIQNTLGEQIGMFKFRPTDFNIVKRYKDVVERFEDVVKPLINANISNTGEGEDEESIAILDEAENKLFELIDYLFDGNAAEAFFGSMHAFSPVGGKFYCENVLEVVGQFIMSQFDEQMNKMSERVDKYTHGYRTGKHKDGKK